ncbi:MAG: hypothetical protein IRZ16_21650 [Myxococcaceae bacterium]|nr:hypothetical protein [Myxococcaceae bacterium]
MRHVLFASVLAMSLCATASSGAAPTETSKPIALHPSEIVDATPEDAERIQLLVVTAILARGAVLAPAGSITQALAARGKPGTCADLQDDTRVACLAELARAVGADRSLLITVAPWAGDRVILTAQVVTASGSVLQELPPFTRLRGSAPRTSDEPVRAALADFVPRINFDPLPEVAITPPTPPAPNEPAGPNGPATSDGTPAVTETPPAPMNLKKPAGYALLGLGAIGLGVGAWGFVDANDAATQWRELYPKGPDPQLAELQNRTRRSSIIGVAGVAAGAALAGVGAYLAWDQSDAPTPTDPPQVSVLPSWNHLTVRVRF